jgi:hypothetical protein
MAASRSRLGLYVPFIGLGLFALAWSAGWFFIARKAEQGLDIARARLAAQGRTLACAQQSFGGYPFRLEFTCEEPVLTSRLPQGEVVMRFKRLSGVAQAYAPRHIILQAQSPATVTLSWRPDAYDMLWNEARASLQLQGFGDVAQTSLELRALAVKSRAGTVVVPVVTAEMAQFHIRRAPDTRPEEETVDLALLATRLVAPEADALMGTSDPIRSEWQIRVTKAEPFLRRGVNPGSLEAWRQAGGQARIVLGRVEKGSALFDVKGTQLDLQAVELEPLLKLAGINLPRGGLTGLLAGVAGNTRQSVVLRGGRAQLGVLPLPIRLPSLY